MLPKHLEALLYLKLNREYWNMDTIVKLRKLFLTIPEVSEEEEDDEDETFHELDEYKENEGY